MNRSHQPPARITEQRPSFDPDNLTLFSWLRESIRLKRPYWRPHWTTNWLNSTFFHMLLFYTLVSAGAIAVLAILGRAARDAFLKTP